MGTRAVGLLLGILPKIRRGFTNTKQPLDWLSVALQIIFGAHMLDVVAVLRGHVSRRVGVVLRVLSFHACTLNGRYWANIYVSP